MELDVQFAYDVLLPLSSAAYKLPLRKGVLPIGYELVAPILLDGVTTPKEDSLRKLVGQQQYGLIYLNEVERILVVAYRGTDDLDDVFKDINIDSVPYKCVADYGEVHEGFQAVYFAIRDGVIKACRNCAGKYDRLVLTGHSLGAAVSELSAPDLYYQHLGAKPEVINFAAPRVGKSDFTDNFDRDIVSCYRIINRWDDVPRVPPIWTGFRHPGKDVEIDGGKTILALHAHSLENSYRPGMEKLAKI